MDFSNCYADDAYAAAYSRLEFPGTYYLAFRDLPELIEQHVRGRRALDFGCGAGRSTRFLASQGFQTIGVDIAMQMVERARAIDPAGDYRLSRDATLSQFEDERFDLILAAFTFDNVPTRAAKVQLFSNLHRLLAPGGRIVNLVSSPEIYWNIVQHQGLSRKPQRSHRRPGTDNRNRSGGSPTGSGCALAG